MSTDVPVRQYTCSVSFFFFGITCTMNLQLISCGTYTQIHPKINLPVYLHASLSSNHKDLPVTTTTCLPAHRCTCSGPYLFMFMLLFRLTTKIYLSTFLHVHRCTCSIGIPVQFISSYSAKHAQCIPVQFISSYSAKHAQLPFSSSAVVCIHRSN